MFIIYNVSNTPQHESTIHRQLLTFTAMSEFLYEILQKVTLLAWTMHLDQMHMCIVSEFL
jgi:hypothetical protein